MKKTFRRAALLTLLALAAPFAALPLARPTAVSSAPPAAAQPAATPQPQPTAVATERSFDAAAPILIEDDGETRTVSVQAFLIGTAASEMPPDWPEDAILAQMVAAHSYALSLNGAAFSCSSARCAGWTDAEVLQARWGDAFDSRLAALAQTAAGAVLCWDGAPAAACYHSISTGRTEASQKVWTQAVPYLQGVASPWDADAPGYETTVTYSAEQVYTALLGLGLAWTTTTMVGSIVHRWCPAHAGKIMGQILAANGVGGAVATQIVTPIIYAPGDAFGYRNAYKLVALILAGKVGSNIASEIGTMRITEQIDALEIMGVNSASYLILPKIIGTVFFFPFLTILSMIIGVAGGYVVSILTGAVNPDSYIVGVQYQFKPFYITYSLIKSSVFAFIITSISGFYGYFANGNSLEVGRASTQAVVVSSIVILIFNLILTQLLLT